MAITRLLFCLGFAHMVLAKGSNSQVECSRDTMKVTVPMDGDRKLSYLEQLKAPIEWGRQSGSPAPGAKMARYATASMEGNLATYELDLQDPHRCGVYKVLNKITGTMSFYKNIVIEDNLGGTETVMVRCVVIPQGQDVRSRRAAELPLDFNEPDDLNITRVEEGRAPEPVLSALVKQNGKQVSGEISVSPGTPLSMEIFLDNSSAPVYGLSVNYMHVTDTGKQQETIILNGCSVDPYLFDNFLTSDGDVLTAKFRAFKFPDTTYVQFKGTVTVCLDKCQGVQCSNGVTGYGKRRRRSIYSGADSNKVYEVSLTTFIKVDWTDGDREPEDVLALLKNLKVANQMLGDHEGTTATVAEQTLDNKLLQVLSHKVTNGGVTLYSSFPIFIASLALTFIK